MALKVKPLSDRIVVRQADAEEMSSGGIILPDTAQEKPQQGKVMSIGPGKLIKMSLKVGDRVLYGKYSGTEVTIDGEEYVFMRESDILAVL